MSLDDRTSRALLALIDYAGKENDRAKLVELVEGINRLLEVVEKRLASFES
jgi:hypothetical protein